MQVCVYLCVCVCVNLHTLTHLYQYYGIGIQYTTVFDLFITVYYVFDVGCLSVCQQHYGNTAGPISMKLGGSVGYGPTKNPLHFLSGYKSRGGSMNSVSLLCNIVR